MPDPGLHPCGHKREMMDVAVSGGWSQTGLRCLKCMEDWQAQGLCFECGKPAAPGCSHVVSGDTLRFCRRHWMDMIRPERCERCGRFIGDGGGWVETGETPGRYDPYWGHEPPEPIGELLCAACMPTTPEKGLDP
jgi:hypothetical protein